MCVPVAQVDKRRDENEHDKDAAQEPVRCLQDAGGAMRWYEGIDGKTLRRRAIELVTASLADIHREDSGLFARRAYFVSGVRLSWLSHVRSSKANPKCSEPIIYGNIAV